MTLGGTLDDRGLFVDRPTAMTTYSGRVIDPVNPDPADIDIEDIAHALSQQCRFVGQTEHYYSTAEHCVRVARLSPEDDKLAALLHDASEYVLSDVAKPVKESDAFAGYRLVEQRLEEAVQLVFDLPVGSWSKAVKAADHRMFQVEAKTLVPRGVGQFVGALAISHYEMPACWSPRVAEAYFLDDFAHYWAKREAKKELGL